MAWSSTVWWSLVMVTLLSSSAHAVELTNIDRDYATVFVISQSHDVAYF